MHACMHVWMYVVYICMCVCMYAHICVYVCSNVCKLKEKWFLAIKAEDLVEQPRDKEVKIYFLSSFFRVFLWEIYFGINGHHPT